MTTVKAKSTYILRDDGLPDSRAAGPEPKIAGGKPPQVVLITGASSGFGLMTAVHLAGKGHHVIATMRDLNKQSVLLSELRRQNIDKHVDIMRLDVNDKESIEAVKKRIALKFGYLDVLLNNAGYGMSGFFEDLSEEDIRSQMETNFFGAQNVTRAMIPLMRPRRKGKIINISSISGQVAYPCFGAYNASKWAMEAWSEALYYELKLFGIDVMLIEPGSYPTSIFYGNARFASRFDDPTSPYYETSQYFKKRVRENIDKNRRDPVEIARLVERLILSNDPPFRNVPDLDCSFILFLRRIMPFSWFSRIVFWGAFMGTKKHIK